MDIDFTSFLNGAIAGLLLWSMLRLERIMNRFERSVKLMARSIIRLLEREGPEAATDPSKTLSWVHGGEE